MASRIREHRIAVLGSRILQYTEVAVNLLDKTVKGNEHS